MDTIREDNRSKTPGINLWLPNTPLNALTEISDRQYSSWMSIYFTKRTTKERHSDQEEKKNNPNEEKKKRKEKKRNISRNKPIEQQEALAARHRVSCGYHLNPVTSPDVSPSSSLLLSTTKPVF